MNLVLLFATCAAIFSAAEAVFECSLCSTSRDPVCGANRRTYVNLCRAGCIGEVAKCEGSCSSCPSVVRCSQCPRKRRMVCGSNGKTYVNLCRAGCVNVVSQCYGRCPCSFLEDNDVNDGIVNENGNGNRRSDVGGTEAQLQCSDCSNNNSPVCGVNGRTYSNICRAGCVNVRIRCDGRCPCRQKTNCRRCSSNNEPVCGADETTYRNLCRGICANVVLRCDGACPCSAANGNQRSDVATVGELQCSDCSNNNSPVCGVDGRTYSNICRAGCVDVRIRCDGRCPCRQRTNCRRCPSNNDPVCGADEITYRNLCGGICANVVLLCDGACPCPAVDGNGNGNQRSIDDGLVDDGTIDDVVSDDGTIDDGVLDDGTIDDGVLDDGTIDDGVVSNGGTSNLLITTALLSSRCAAKCENQREPVCGTNRKTYTNICNAKCNGRRVKCYRACPCTITKAMLNLQSRKKYRKSRSYRGSRRKYRKRGRKYGHYKKRKYGRKHRRY